MNFIIRKIIINLLIIIKKKINKADIKYLKKKKKLNFYHLILSNTFLPSLYIKTPPLTKLIKAKSTNYSYPYILTMSSLSLAKSTLELMGIFLLMDSSTLLILPYISGLTPIPSSLPLEIAFKVEF